MMVLESFVQKQLTSIDLDAGYFVTKDEIEIIFGNTLAKEPKFNGWVIQPSVFFAILLKLVCKESSKSSNNCKIEKKKKKKKKVYIFFIFFFYKNTK